jgi:general secretion pathway protein L
MSIAVGIDIGAFAVKVAVLRVAYRKTTLEALASAEIAAAGGVQEAIRAASAEALAGKPADGIAVAIEGIRSVVHTLSLPAGAAKQLDEVLPFELEAALPVDMAESTFDFRVRTNRAAGFDTTEAAAQISVLALIARTEDVRGRITLVKDALGQEPERVGAGALTLANLIASIPVLAEEGTVVLIDIGQRSTEILIIANGEPVFARALSWGTEGLSSVTAQKIARELRVTIGAHRASGGNQPSRVFLCGGGGLYATSAEAFFAADLGIPVEKLPPLAIEQTGLSPERVEQVPVYAKALGLALGLNGRAPGLDLRRGPLAYERGFAWVREKIPVLAGLGAVIIVSFLFSAWAELYAANKDVTTLEAALETVTKDVLGEETADPARAQKLLSQQGGGADDDPLPHVDAFDVMIKLSEDIPQSTTHDVEDLDVQKQHVTMHGIVGTIPEGQSIKTSLESERCFQEVNITQFNQQPGTDRQKYTLTLDLLCPGDPGGKKKKPASSTSGGSGASSSGGGE